MPDRASGVHHARCAGSPGTEAVIDVIRFVFPVIFGGLAIVLILNPEWLRDKPHPDEQRYPPHRSLRVVQEAPDGEDVTA